MDSIATTEGWREAPDDYSSQHSQHLDRLEQQRHGNGQAPQAREGELRDALQLASASMSPADRHVIRIEGMTRRIEAAARSRAAAYGGPDAQRSQSNRILTP